MNISFFEAYCKACTQLFSTPLLSDFTYGNFLYYSTNGQTVRYYEALNSPGFKKVEAIVEQKASRSVDQTQGAIICSIIGRLVDNPPKFGYYTADIICPNCGKKAQQANPNKKTGSQEVKPFRFNNYRIYKHYFRERNTP